MDRRRRGRLATVATVATVALAAAACGADGDGAVLSEDAAEGRRIARRAGCAACHGADGQGGIGPGWVGTLGTSVQLEDGSTATVDEAYLTRAIAEPDAEVHAGFDVQMPSNDLTEEEIAKVVAYIVELGDDGEGQVAG